jgi:hypothetical protein
LWFEHVLEAFTEQGFRQCQIDPYILYKETILIVIHVNDVCIADANDLDLDKLLQNLTKHGLEFTKEGTFTDFLGIYKGPTKHHCDTYLTRFGSENDCNNRNDEQLQPKLHPSNTACPWN